MHFPKPNLHQERIMVTVWWSVAHLIHYSFLNPGETITSENYAQQIDEMHQKLQCLQLALVNRKGPILLDSAQLYITQPTLQKLKNWETKFCLIHYVHLTSRQQTPRSSSISTTFCREMLPQPAGCRKCFPRIHRILKHGSLCCRNKQTIFLWQKCVD